MNETVSAAGCSSAWARRPLSGSVVDDAALRHTMGAFPSGVTILTTQAADRPVGMTISSFASVSMDPPLILQCVARTARSLAALRIGGSVVVNVLAHDQQKLAQRFASRTEDRFAGLDYDTDLRGIPVLRDSAAWIGGAIQRLDGAGDHVIALIAVRSVHRSERPPLLYHSGRMHDWPVAAAG